MPALGIRAEVGGGGGGGGRGGKGGSFSILVSN